MLVYYLGKTCVGKVLTMLKITGPGSITTCDGITRRDFLQVGTLGALGFGLSQYASLNAMGAVKGGNDKSCIMISTWARQASSTRST